MILTSAHREASLIVGRLAGLRFPNSFNPYAEICARWDRRDSPRIRRANLYKVLVAGLSGGVDSIWIARDLGYRGGRRTGLPMTDEFHLADQARLLGSSTLLRATHGPMVRERTASMVWSCLRALDRRVFLWNVFPLHPYSSEDEMSNRRHTAAEGLECRSLLTRVIQAFQPCSIVGIGRDAERSLAGFKIPAVAVRHPSYGGEKEFRTGLADHYGSHID